MDKDQFREQIEGFLDWTAQHDRPASSWFLSLKDWADMNFHYFYDKEKKSVGYSSSQ